MVNLYIWNEIDIKFQYWLKELTGIKNKLMDVDKNDKMILKSLFVYSISIFENAMNDILEHYFYSFPDKIPGGKKQEFTITDVLGMNSNDLISKCIEKALYNTGMKELNSGFFKVLDLDDLLDADINKIVEIKETRNLVIHHNLKITERYVQLKNKRCKECEVGEVLEFNYNYVCDSLDFIFDIFNNNIYLKMKNKYQSFNKIKAMREVWEMYAPRIMKFEKTWDFDESLGKLNKINSEYVRESFDNLSTGEQMVMKQFLMKYHGDNPFRHDDHYEYFREEFDNVFYLFGERKRLVLEIRKILLEHPTLFEQG